METLGQRRPAIVCAAFLTLVASTCWAGPAGVDGFGSISTNSGQSDRAYESPDFLIVGRSVQSTGSPVGELGDKVLAYHGEAQFGRLAATSHIGGNALGLDNLSTGVSLGLGFFDTISPLNLNPLGSNFLRLDVSLSGTMIGAGATDSGNTIGALTNASFEVTIFDPADHERFRNLSFVNFARFGSNAFITNNSADFMDTPRFIPYPGEEPGFKVIPGPGTLPIHAFGARGYIDVPLDGNLESQEGDGTFLTPGGALMLEFNIAASSSCGNEKPTCTASTDFGSTALIGNARIVDQFGNIVAGASFTSASGYDYITPPGSLVNVAAVPEPETWALMFAGLGVLGFVSRRRKR